MDLSSGLEFNCIFSQTCNLLNGFRIPVLTPRLWKFRILFLIHGKTKIQTTTVRVTRSLNKNHTHHTLLYCMQTQIAFEVSRSSSVGYSQHYIRATPQLLHGGHYYLVKALTVCIEMCESDMCTSHCKAMQ